MIIHNPILTGSFTVNGTDVASITSSAASLTSLNAYTASQNILNGTYATTGSNTFAGIQTVNSNLVVTGSITAQTLVVQTITSSVDFVTGSTRFGSVIGNTHVFTGSVSISGSLSGTSAIFSAEVTSLGGQGRFGGWATGEGYQGNALEVGVSGGTATLIGYNRTSGVYIPLTIGGNTNQTTTIGGNTIVLQNNGTTALTIASTGAATFSSSVTADYLTANSGALINTTSAPFVLYNSGGGGNAKRFALNMTNGDYMKIYSLNDNGTTRTDNIITATIGGNVGIGTSSPACRLDILGTNEVMNISGTNATSAYTGYYYNTSTLVGYIGNGSSILSGAASSDFIFRSQGALVYATNGNNERMRINSSGTTIFSSASPVSVRINSTTQAYLEIQNNGTTVSYLGSGGQLVTGGGANDFALTSNANNILFATSGGTERMRITGGGQTQITGPSLSAGSQSTYALQLGQSGNTSLTLSMNSSAGYIQTWASTPLYLNQQGNSVSANGSAGFGVITTTSSDIRIKKNVLSIESALDKVNALRGVYYEFDENNELEVVVPHGKTRVGLIAQEVETIIPEAVIDGDNENIPKSVDYTGLVGVLVKAIQELKAEIDELKNK